MKLEVISRQPDYPNAAPPLLFIHGANSGAWVWEQHFLGDMAERGFEAHALSLRGHGESDGRVYLPDFSWTVEIGHARAPYMGVDPRGDVRFPGILKATR